MGWYGRIVNDDFIKYLGNLIYIISFINVSSKPSISKVLIHSLKIKAIVKGKV